VDKNTTFTRIRLNRKEEDIVTNQLICINCDSKLGQNDDYCAHCCFQYDRKLGATTGGVSAGVSAKEIALNEAEQIAKLEQQQQKNTIQEMAAVNQEDKQKAEEGWKMRSKLILPSY
jgi:hypothetical protein